MRIYIRVTILFTIFFIGCKKNNIKKDYSLVKYKEDSTIIYKEGFIDSISYFINDKRNLDDIYFVIQDSNFINQKIKYYQSGEVNYDDSYFYNISLPNTIKVNQKFNFKIKLNAPIVGMKELYISELKLSDEIEQDFSNSKNIYDLIDILKQEKVSNYIIRQIDTNEWQVESLCKSVGKNYIKGIIYYATYEQSNISKDSIEYKIVEKNFFIKKSIFVRE